MFSFYLPQIELEDLIERTLSLYHPAVLNGGEDILIFCEHPKTFSLGKNFKGLSETETSLEEWKKKNYSVVNCDRGGQATYHGPGHLMIYPIVNLKIKKLGIKKFIELFLNSIVNALESSGFKSFIDNDKLGVWVELEKLGKFKITSLGLRLDQGITRHGASLYVDGDMGPFSYFSPCGDSNTRTISIKKIYEIKELLHEAIDFSTLKYILMAEIRNNLRSALENL